jgi:hypothetical protein
MFARQNLISYVAGHLDVKCLRSLENPTMTQFLDCELEEKFLLGYYGGARATKNPITP